MRGKRMRKIFYLSPSISLCSLRGKNMEKDGSKNATAEGAIRGRGCKKEIGCRGRNTPRRISFKAPESGIGGRRSWRGSIRGELASKERLPPIANPMMRKEAHGKVCALSDQRQEGNGETEREGLQSRRTGVEKAKSPIRRTNHLDGKKSRRGRERRSLRSSVRGKG